MVGGGDFDIYELSIEIVDEIKNPHLPVYRVIVERAYDDLLPLPAEVIEMPELKSLIHGYVMPERPDLPTADDPLIVTSHTADGGGWINYKIYAEEV